MTKKDLLVSVIVPVYNEQGNIQPFLDRLLPILHPYHYEVVFVNDGSKDNTTEELRKHTKEKNIKVIEFQRNFGHQMALCAGYENAEGDCVISMDVDLQDPPEIIPQMIEKWQNGAFVVYAKRSKREVDDMFKRQTARMFYRFINFLSDTPVPEDVGDYRLLDKKVVTFINSLPEHSRFLRGLVSWSGFPSEYVYYERAARESGETHYTVGKMMNFALDGITSLSAKPLRIATYLGFISGAIGFLGIVYAFIEKLFLPAHLVSGWTALFVGIMFIGGVQLITIGIIGEYIGKIYKEILNRPKYIIRDTVNL